MCDCGHTSVMKIILFSPSQMDRLGVS